MTFGQCMTSGPVHSPIISVVDTDATVRKALELLIRSAGWTARTFVSGWEFLRCPRVLTPGCLIIDVALSDVSGLEVQQRIAGCPEVPIIFVAREIDVLTTVQAMKAGALEFMLKPFQDDVMLNAIASAIEHSCVALSREAGLRALRQRHASLSHRERQVMDLVVQGRLNKLIAADLGISEITVKAHRGKVMRKMDAHSLPELVTIAARLGAPAPDAPWIERSSTRYSTRLPRGQGDEALHAS